MANAKTKNKLSRLAKALLETAGDMRESGLLGRASHRTITRRHLGTEAAKPARLSAAQIRQPKSEKRAKGRKLSRNRMAEN